MVRSVVAGLGNKDYRQALEGLLSEGWTVKKTNGNHLRLEHPEASSPVFASSTPNLSPRSIKNMEAQCRRALRPAPLPAPTVQKQVEEIAMPSRSRKRRKPRHSEMMLMGQSGIDKPLLGQMGGMDAAGTGFDLPHKTSAVSAAALGAASPMHLAREEGPPPAFEHPKHGARAAKPQPTTGIDRSSMIIETEKNTTTDPATETAEQDKSMIPNIDNRLVEAASPAVKDEKLVALVTPMPAMASAPVSAEPVHADAALLEILMQIQRGEHDKLMGLAGRIHRGELKPITVTADMVGATIWVSTDAVVAAPAPAATKPAAASRSAVAKAEVNSPLPAASMKRFETLLPLLTDEWQPLTDLLQAASLTNLGEGERQCYRAAFRRAADAGLVDRLDSNNGKIKLYRKLG